MNKKNLFFGLMVFFLLATPVQGQLLRKTVGAGVKAALEKAMGKTGGTAVEKGAAGVLVKEADLLPSREIRMGQTMRLSNPAQEVSADALGQALHQSYTQMVERNMRHSLVRVIQPSAYLDEREVLGSGFVFEAAGRTWALTVHHVATEKGAQVWLMLDRTDGRTEVVNALVSATGRGGRNGIDLSLIEISPALAHYLRPLRWSEELPQVSQVVSSYGFNSRAMWPTRFKKTTDRQILDVTGLKISTTFNFEEGIGSRACGSPLINDKGLVVGVHTGSERSREKSFALTYEAVQDIVKAATTGHAYRALKLKGRRLGEIDITEQIRSIVITRQTEVTVLLQEIYIAPIDYNALEKIYNFKTGDEVKLVIDGPQQTEREIIVKLD